MRILFFSDHLRPEPSAPAAHVYERAKLWVEWGHQVTIMGSCPNFPDGKAYDGYKNRWRAVEMLDGIRVVRCKTYITANKGFFKRILDYLSYMASAFFFAFWEEKPDVVIATSPHLFVAMSGSFYARLRRIPFVFEIRDLWPASIIGTTALKKGKIYRFFEAIELYLYKNAARIICMTPAFQKDLISRKVQAEKTRVVINGANLTLFQPREKAADLVKRYQLESYQVVGYLGTIGLASGLQNLLKTAERLRSEPVKFLIVGSGALLQELEQTALEKNLKNVIFTGRQLKEKMPDFWSICDISLIHLRNDPVFKTVIPSKIFESMAMGLPIIYAGPDGEGPDLVRQHEAGLHVAPDEPKALAEAIVKLLASTKLRQTYGQNSRNSAALYSRERHAQESLNVLQEALGVADQ